MVRWRSDHLSRYGLAARIFSSAFAHQLARPLSGF
jgi:hypothetical protein